MSIRIKVLVVGLGQIGIETCNLILEKDSLELVAAVDADPKKSDRDLGDLLGQKKLGVKVYDDLRKALEENEPEVTIITTKSFLRDIVNDILLCIDHHSSVISSCEELFFPFEKYPKLVEEIDLKAKENFVHVLGTGVNPGFIMDTLPVFITSVCTDIKSITIRRIVDLSKRRKSLQQKMGLGLDLNSFKKLLKENKIGHVGLLESTQFISHFIKLNVEKFNVKNEPLVAKQKIKTKHFEISKGEIVGIKQIVIGLNNQNKKIIDLSLEMRADINENYDEIEIKGTPPIKLIVKNGISGDIATVAMIVNVIPNLLRSRYGLITMKEILLPSILNT